MSEVNLKAGCKWVVVDVITTLRTRYVIESPSGDSDFAIGCVQDFEADLEPLTTCVVSDGISNVRTASEEEIYKIYKEESPDEDDYSIDEVKENTFHKIKERGIN